MSHAYRLIKARTAYTTSGASDSLTLQAGDTVIVCMIKTTGATTRLAVAPSVGGISLTQANSTQLAAASPEASCELWYLLNPSASLAAGSQTFAMPNSGAVTGFYTWAAGQSATGKSAFQGANGANGTAVNPAPGSVTPSAIGDIGFAITAGGWTTWAPSAQAGTVIANTDDGADGGGEQYIITPNATAVNLGWTFATSDDWGAVAAFFKEVPKGRITMMNQAVKRASYY
jgi:hypothetical protein